jgi:hypothetical protein
MRGLVDEVVERRIAAEAAERDERRVGVDVVERK